MIEHITDIQRVAKIKEFVDLQATDEWLWGFPIDRNETIQESYLKQALRKLHMIIESNNEQLINEMIFVYKKQLEDL